MAKQGKQQHDAEIDGAQQGAADVATDATQDKVKPELTSSKEALGELLNKTLNSIHRIEERSLHTRLTEGLTIGELHTICAVGMYEKASISQIAERLEVTLASVTVGIDKLERRGYVTRERSTEDRRKVLVELTKRGRMALRANNAFKRKMVISALADLTEEEDAILLSAITKLKKAFDEEDARLSALEEKQVRATIR